MHIGNDSAVREITSRLAALRPGDGAVKVEGSWGSFARLLAAHVAAELKRPILYITPHIDDADSAGDDLGVFAERSVDTFPAWESDPSGEDASDDIGTERLRLAVELSHRHHAGTAPDFMVTTSVQALMQPIPEPSSLETSSLVLRTGQTIDPEKVAGWLADNSFESVDRVDMPGQFARRGGIIDIYAPVAALHTLSEDLQQPSPSSPSRPIRVEFFGDQVESIRSIDIDTQRSSENIESLSILPPLGSLAAAKPELLLNILPAETIIIFEEPSDAQEVAQVFLDRVAGPDKLYNWKSIFTAAGHYSQLHICRFATAEKGQFIHVPVKSTQQFERQSGPIWAGNKAAIEEVRKAAGEGEVYLYCENIAEVKRLTEIITEGSSAMPPGLHLPIGFVHEGFVIESLSITVISHHELFGQFALRRRIRKVHAATAIESFLDLQRGDYVVHVSYGIGRFLGIKTIVEKDRPTEYLTIEYADKELIHVPVQTIALVQKYVGTMPRRPKLSKIGSKRWANQKAKVIESVNDLAGELLRLQAQRQQLGGFAFPADANWQREFEESFPYQETADQTSVMEDIKADMQDHIPMDRLLCGDVGYGKTELAMRAAFKCIEGGRQVAVLVPTTVLCVQHGRTFTERFADFPISVETLNRFKTPKQAKDIVKRLKEGRLDIVIGTHRLLSKDIDFANLGLLVIDEEQRFGVEHKERLKSLRANVDILTMTATPIPRTLHLSMLGIRDISSLTTPPLDRRAVVTSVSRYDRHLIHDAIFRELNRQGQVFFLHNRVQSIYRMASEIAEITEGQARIDIGHGQMHKHELEKAMLKFVMGQTDVLVCTTIIESGLDIPNANTILINDADRFGLAELHQLRGRVGRYKHRAYAYMLLPADRTITPVAAKRLKAIEEYAQLGAGFKIALRDLEIRGAGNILGPEQSGHIQTVGYEMYCRMLADAVKRLKDEPVEKEPTAIVDLGLPTYIPKNYISSDRQRLDIYRRISSARITEDLKRLETDLRDLFGPVPAEVDQLLQWAEIRILASACEIKSILINGRDLIFSLEGGNIAAPIFARAPGKVSIPDPKTVYVRLEKSYFEPATLLSVLRKLLSGAAGKIR
jgi:transcription-repair coupling factor (superfamily II helicase)